MLLEIVSNISISFCIINLLNYICKWVALIQIIKIIQIKWLQISYNNSYNKAVLVLVSWNGVQVKNGHCFMQLSLACERYGDNRSYSTRRLLLLNTINILKDEKNRLSPHKFQFRI